MATTAPRPIPTRPTQGRERSSSFPAFNAPQPQPYHPQPPNQPQDPYIRRGPEVPPPSAPPNSLPPAEYGSYGSHASQGSHSSHRSNNYAPPPQQDIYSSSPRSYATTPGVGYPQQPYSNQASQGYGFPQNGQTQYNPPDRSQYPASAYSYPQPQQQQPQQQQLQPQSQPQQARLHPQDAYERDPNGHSPPRQIGPPPSNRRRHGSVSVPEGDYYPPHASGQRLHGTSSAPDENTYQPRDARARRGRGHDRHNSYDEGAHRMPPPAMHNTAQRRRMSYDPGFGGEPAWSDFEDDYPPRRYSYDDDYEREEEMERRRRHEERKQEKRRRRQESTSSKGSVDRGSVTFGDSVMWVTDKMREKLHT